VGGLKDLEGLTYLAGSALRSTTCRGLGKDRVSWGEGSRVRVAISSPVRARLGVQSCAVGMGIVVGHVLLVAGVRGVLPVRIGRASGCDGWIYRYFAVRLDLLGVLMGASILQRHGRTCWCLRHTASASVRVAGWVV